MDKNELEIIDTFPAFWDWWECAKNLPIDAQMDQWKREYMSRWPDLLAMQVEDYGAQAIDWRMIARERIFPYLPERLPYIQVAHDNLVNASETTFAQAVSTLGLRPKACFVIYVGIGCGAGWATRFREAPAVLFGLENIAESGWCDADAIRGLMAHELGHLAHYGWRDPDQQPIGEGPWWQLYEEGFANFCESLVLDTGILHQARGKPGWLDWCQEQRGWLAAEFLRRADGGEAVAPFFGSWFDLQGWQETGHFLGYEVIRCLAEGHTLSEIARLDDPESAMRPIVRRLQGIADSS